MPGCEPGIELSRFEVDRFFSQVSRTMIG